MLDVPLHASLCPLCGSANGCVAVASRRFDVSCWCKQETFPPALLQRLPADAHGRGCICRRCAQAHASAASAAGGDAVSPLAPQRTPPS